MNKIIEIGLLYNPRSESCQSFSRRFGNWKTSLIALSPFCIDSQETKEYCQRQGITELPCIVMVKRNEQFSKISLKQGDDCFLWMEKTFSHLQKTNSSLIAKVLAKEVLAKEVTTSTDLAKIAERAKIAEGGKIAEIAEGTKIIADLAKSSDSDSSVPKKTKSILEQAMILQEQRELTKIAKIEQQQQQQRNNMTLTPRLHSASFAGENLASSAPLAKTAKTVDSPQTNVDHSTTTTTSHHLKISPFSTFQQHSSQKNEMWKNLLPENTIGGSVSSSIQDSDRTKSVTLLAKKLEKDREIVFSSKSLINI